MKTSKPPKPTRIAVCGFNDIGYDIRNAEVAHDDVIVRFCAAADMSVPLDDFDGVILVSGIFEKIVPADDFSDGYQFKTDIQSMLNRERELRNLTQAHRWVVFLVREICDDVSGGMYGRVDGSRADLTKVYLNRIKVNRRLVEGSSAITCLSDEFRPYIKLAGVARTQLLVPKDLGERFDVRTIAEGGGKPVGFAVECMTFFLPFLPAGKTQADADKISLSIIEAVRSYRLKNQLSLPDWLQELTFSQEAAAIEKLRLLTDQIAQTEEDISYWVNAKGMLTNSGSNLVSLVAHVLTSFWGLKCCSDDEYREDISIVDENDEIVAVVEVKGVNKGIKREPINQVDSHRDRSELPATLPGLLIVNSHMDEVGYGERRKAQVSSESVQHAVTHNVLVVRTIDFLDAMKCTESISIEERRKLFLCWLAGGGGRLLVKDGKVSIERAPTPPGQSNEQAS